MRQDFTAGHGVDGSVPCWIDGYITVFWLRGLGLTGENKGPGVEMSEGGGVLEREGKEGMDGVEKEVWWKS